MSVWMSRPWVAATGGLRSKGGVSRDLSHVHTRERKVGNNQKMCEVCECSTAYVYVCVGRSPISRSVSTLQDIPEVMDELLERAAAESPR